MKDSKNPAVREHIINTEWQKLVDRVYNSDAAEYVHETELALELLQACRFPISYELVRIGAIRMSDAVLRIHEERKGGTMNWEGLEPQEYYAEQEQKHLDGFKCYVFACLIFLAGVAAVGLIAWLTGCWGVHNG